MKRSCSANVALMCAVHDRRMKTERRPAEDLLDVARVLLLVQGAILVATTIDASIWGAIFSGAPGAAALMSAAAAGIVLIARVRIRPDRRRIRRLVYVIEGVILATFAIESVLSILLAGTLPPLAALLTQLTLPLSVIALLHRSSRAAIAMSPIGVGILEGSR
jgi:hypothetical protein